MDQLCEEHGLAKACGGPPVTFGGAFCFIAGRHRPSPAWEPKIVRNGVGELVWVISHAKMPLDTPFNAEWSESQLEAKCNVGNCQ